MHIWKNNKKPILDKKAFTLIELLVALSLALLIGVAVSKILITSVKNSTSSTQEIYARKNARIAIRTITKDLMGAEQVASPAKVGDEGNNLVIAGYAQKNKKMQPVDSGHIKVFEAKDSIVKPWVEGKLVVVYGNGENLDSGYNVNSGEGTITFEGTPPENVTADFSYNVNVRYSINGGELVRTVERANGTLIERRSIADHVDAGTMIFSRQGQNLFGVSLNIDGYTLRTVLDKVSGVCITDESRNLREDLGLADNVALPNLNSLYFNNPDDGWVAGNNGTIYRFNESGWQSSASGTTQNLRGISFADEQTGVIAGDSGTILNLTGATWGSLLTGFSDNLRSIYMKDNSYMVAIGGDNDGGTSRTFNDSNWSKEPRGQDVGQLNGLTQDFERLYAVSESGEVYAQKKSDIFGTGSEGSVTITGTENIEKYKLNYDPDNGVVPSFNDLTIDSGAVLTTHKNIPIVFRVRGTLTVRGTIDANGKSDSGPGDSYDSDNGQCGCGDWSGGGGGSYGGSGGRGKNCMDDYCEGEMDGTGGSGGPTYADFPAMGSAGGGGAGHGTHSAGGGKIVIYASNTNFETSGNISANAAVPNYYCGGGSGGSVYVITDNNISNAQIVHANGANASEGAGGGGGGRVIIEAPQVPGGTPSVSGGGTSGGGTGGESGVYQHTVYNEFDHTGDNNDNVWKPIYDGDAALKAADYANTHKTESSYNFLWVVGGGGTLLRYDRSASVDDPWKVYTDNEFGNLRSIDFYDKEVGWAVGENGAILRYDSSVDQWFQVSSKNHENLNAVYMLSRDEGYIVGDNGTLLKIESVKE